MNQRLDVVEGKVQDCRHCSNRGKDCSKLSNIDYSLKNGCKSVKSKSSKYVVESSSDEEILPSLSVLKSSREIQKQVDARISQIEAHSNVEGNCSEKLKSKRGEGSM